MTYDSELIFKQKMTIEMDSTRGGVEQWKKEAVLRIFANWCHQNSHEIHLTPWQCLTREMTLFDVVYLDILHEFDVPNNVLLEYVDREWSAEVVCKLATCYSMTTLKRKDHKNKVEYSLHFKTLLMIHRAIKYKHPTLESIITSVSVLMRCKEYEISANVLESAIQDCSSEMRCIIHWKEFYADLVSHKMKNEFQEISDIHMVGGTGNIHTGMFQSIRTLVGFSLSVCYKYCGNENKREDLLKLMSSAVMFFGSNGQEDEYFFPHNGYALLMLDVFENSKKWRYLYYKIYKKFMSNKFKLIERESEARKRGFEEAISVDQRRDMYFPVNSTFSLCSCNFGMTSSLKVMAYHLRISAFDTLKRFEPMLTYSMSTTADRIYFCQVLIFNRKLEQAISILKVIVEQEGDYSISMVIWPRELYGSRFIDENIRNELIKSSKDYIVFPTNLYARYLLTIAYSSLGQEKNSSNNLAELNVLRERYSDFQEFAPMLDIMSRVVG